jgi:hypothetical protein
MLNMHSNNNKELLFVVTLALAMLGLWFYEVYINIGKI